MAQISRTPPGKGGVGNFTAVEASGFPFIAEFEASAQRLSSKFSIPNNHARLILGFLWEGRRHV